MTPALLLIYAALLGILIAALSFQSRLTVRVRHLFRRTPILFSSLDLPPDVDLREVLENPRLFYFCLAHVGTLLRILIAVVLLLTLDLPGVAGGPAVSGLLVLGLILLPSLIARLGYRPTPGLGRAAARTIRVVGQIVRLFPGTTATAAAEKPDRLQQEILTRVDGQEFFDADERRFLSGLLALKRTTAHQVMVPRDRMVVIDSDWSVARAARAISGSTYARLPVCERRPDEIVGLVHTKDLVLLLHAGQGGNLVKSIMREMTYVPFNQHLDRLLREFQSRRIHLAVVQDEYGKTSGLITMDDILHAALGYRETR